MIKNFVLQKFEMMQLCLLVASQCLNVLLGVAGVVLCDSNAKNILSGQPKNVSYYQALNHDDKMN